MGESAHVDGFAGPDPAERSAFNRLFYRNRRPTSVGHWVSQFFCWWARLGLPPKAWVALRVRDRVSGRMRQDAVVISTVAGHQYVVSMFGAISDWVHNLDAANGDAFISHGRSMRVPLVNVAPDERAQLGAVRTTRSATVPRIKWATPVRRCVPMTIRSAGVARA